MLKWLKRIAKRNKNPYYGIDAFGMKIVVSDMGNAIVYKKDCLIDMDVVVTCVWNFDKMEGYKSVRFDALRFARKFILSQNGRKYAEKNH